MPARALTFGPIPLPTAPTVAADLPALSAYVVECARLAADARSACAASRADASQYLRWGMATEAGYASAEASYHARAIAVYNRAAREGAILYNGLAHVERISRAA